ncbi:MAG TPA: multidrug efflux SMR transporter [Burkholderiaceae bacterium]|nr:multidrug efflux SMR transporter [Burkholderiaceae bacterium]
MHWYFLAAAIVFEVAGSTSMKLSQGLSKLGPTTMMFAFYAVAFACNAMALKRLDLSVTYAIWSGMGTALVAVIGIAWFQEPASALRLGSIGLIIAGVVGLAFSARGA